MQAHLLGNRCADDRPTTTWCQQVIYGLGVTDRHTQWCILPNRAGSMFHTTEVIYLKGIHTEEK